MCHESCIEFGKKYLSKEEIKGKRIIEVGSLDINGSLRCFITSLEPETYIGVDIRKGSGVDVICSAENIIKKFGKERFDIVISTELLEHIKNWKIVISNIKNICKPGGMVLITTRSYGFKYHGFPCDFWRYELDDMKNIFSDYEILVLEKDFLRPGTFIKATKPNNFVEKDLSNYKLYNIVQNKKII